jgi:hypothetical protein
MKLLVEVEDDLRASYQAVDRTQTNVTFTPRCASALAAASPVQQNSQIEEKQ